jgi:hypothetical protein
LSIVLKLFFFAVCAVSALYLVAQAFRSSRRLDSRIRQFKAEQEENAQSGKPLNPYLAMAELYAASNEPPRRPRRRNKRSH